jgi:hypothetical protein
MLIAIATVDDLMRAGYTKSGAYKAKEWGVISDEKCEKLVQVLGNRANDVLIQALREFALQLNCKVNC